MFRKQALACSFCRRSEAQVAKLVAGPRVYICDECVAMAQRIMDASHDEPSSSAPRPGVLMRALRAVRRGLRLPGAECHAAAH